jgi:organic hydroperoxide reductase OsmC/OhrA
MRLKDGYRFEVDFGLEEVPSLQLDEPPPLGDGDGPNAARLLAAAVGNCLASSALFCLRKARVPVTGMEVSVVASVVRNEAGRLRIPDIDVVLRPHVAEDDAQRLDRCLDLFEDFCMVTQSVRGGIAVEVEVEPKAMPARVVKG